MCGIAGYISHQTKISTGLLKKMTDAIAHRGPDGEGFWLNPSANVGLGHRRLAIIDLSDNARQPMSYQNERYKIIFNGEIYNYVELRECLIKRGYQFQNDSDTEVLLALYDWKGEQCLQELDGMFAFAIWDEQKQTLFCARDRFGEKPFYYSVHNNALYFASEMKALWAAGVPRRNNNQMLFNFIAYGYTFNFNDTSETFFEGIRKLKAAHYFTVSPNRILPEPKRYWDIDYSEKDERITEEESAETFRQLFYESVKRRLRSDVPVGSSLSGGLDSSLVVCVIDKINRDKNIDQNTFSARFPGFAKDEGKYMEIVINQTRVSPHFVFPDEKGMLNDLDILFHHQEEPFGSASIYVQYCVMRLAKEKNVTVLLDGQGADEILAGYHFYFPDFFRELKLNDKNQWQKEKRSYKNLHATGFAKTGVQPFLKKILKFFPQNVENQIRVLNAGFWQKVKPVMNSDFYHEYLPLSQHPQTRTPNSLAESLYKIISNGSLEELLRYADRNSMAHSREVRLPFLNHNLVEFMFRLPSGFLIREGMTKYIMRRAFADVLPSAITNRVDKIGYEPPQESWLKNSQVISRLSDFQNQLQQAKILNKNFSLVNGKVKNQAMAWRTLMTGLLMEK